MSTFSFYSTTGQWFAERAEGDSHADALERWLDRRPAENTFWGRYLALASGPGIIVVEEDALGVGTAKLVRAEKIERPTYRTFVVES